LGNTSVLPHVLFKSLHNMVDKPHVASYHTTKTTACVASELARNVGVASSCVERGRQAAHATTNHGTQATRGKLVRSENNISCVASGLVPDVAL